jgi:hypothetical protein
MKIHSTEYASSAVAWVASMTICRWLCSIEYVALLLALLPGVLQEGGDQQQQLAGGMLVQKQRLKFTKFSNAYMLVYVRLSDWQRYMSTVTKDGIAPYLLERLEVRPVSLSPCTCVAIPCRVMKRVCTVWRHLQLGKGGAVRPLQSLRVPSQRCSALHSNTRANNMPAGLALLNVSSLPCRVAYIFMQAEQREKERRQKEKQEAHLYCHVRIATDADIAQQVGVTPRPAASSA